MDQNSIRQPAENNGKKLWFKAKRYGWGWTPITWQGWVIVAVYTFAIAFIFSRTAVQAETTGETLFQVALPFIVLTSFLFYICYKKGEKPGWRWGEKK